MDKEDRNLKCVIVGDGAVGKTCMLLSYTTQLFQSVHVPTVMDSFEMSVIVEGKRVTMEVFDTAGECFTPFFLFELRYRNVCRSGGL
jgi:Ras-related C3 botulinum toxin substrate 1